MTEVYKLLQRSSMETIKTHRFRVNQPKFIILTGLAAVLAIANYQPTFAFERYHPPSQTYKVKDSDGLVNKLARLEARINAGANRVSIEEAVNTGIMLNPQLLQAFSAIQQFEWQLIAAKRQWYPTLQLNNGVPFAGVQWSSAVQKFSTKRESSQPTIKNYSQLSAIQPGVVANWNALDFTRQPNINAANEALLQQKLLFEVSARNLILDIQQSYYELQSSQQLIKNFRAIYEINRRQLSILEAQRLINMSTVLDVEATRSQLFSQLNQLVLYTRNYIEQSAALAEAMGLPDGTLAIPSQATEPLGDWLMPLEQTITVAKKQREEILASLAAAEAAKWTGISALRSYLPVFQVTATGSWITNRGNQTSIAGDLINYEGQTTIQNNNTAVGIGFTWSLFDGGIQAANAEAANAQTRQQKAQASSTKLQVVRQVRSSYSLMETSRIGMISATQAYRAAKLAEQAAWARYSVGVGDITSVVQAVDLLSTAAQQESEATLAYKTAISQLYRFAAIWPLNTQTAVKRQLLQFREKPTTTETINRP